MPGTLDCEFKHLKKDKILYFIWQDCSIISGLGRSKQGWGRRRHPQDSQIQQLSWKSALVRFGVGETVAHLLRPGLLTLPRGEEEKLWGCSITSGHEWHENGEWTPILSHTQLAQSQIPPTPGWPYPQGIHVRGSWGGVKSHQKPWSTP